MTGGSEGQPTVQLIVRLTASWLEGYAENPVLRAFVAAVPVVGASFDAFVGTSGSNVVVDRL